MSLRPSARVEVRRSRYKVAVDADEGRRRREDGMVEIRKSKREENLLKKRREGMPGGLSSMHGDGTSTFDHNVKVEDLQPVVASIISDDRTRQLEATTQFRRLLSIEPSPPIDRIIETGVVPRLVEFLTRDDFPQLQFEATWAVTNIASGTSKHTMAVVDRGAVPILVKLLSSPRDEIREQAVWALGNITGDSAQCRDLVLEHGVLAPLLLQFNANTRMPMLRNATWTLSHCFRGKPPLAFDQKGSALPILRSLIQSSDEEVLTDACWALSYISDGANIDIQSVIESGACPRLVALLNHSSPPLLIPALRAVGNIVTGDDLQTQYIIDLQVLPRLLNFLSGSFKKSIKRESLWIVSNITAGNKDQIQAVIDADIIGPVIDLLKNGDFEIKKEAAWAISNATSGGNHDQIKYLVGKQCIEPLCDMLGCPDPKMIMVCLEAIENIIKVGEAEMDGGDDINLFTDMVDDFGGLDKIEGLQRHGNEEVYRKAVEILEKYCAADEVKEEG